jgi:hypothetical protein
VVNEAASSSNPAQKVTAGSVEKVSILVDNAEASDTFLNDRDLSS